MCEEHQTDFEQHSDCWQIALCPNYHSWSYKPPDGPPKSRRCMSCDSPVITLFIPFSLFHGKGETKLGVTG